MARHGPASFRNPHQKVEATISILPLRKRRDLFAGVFLLLMACQTTGPTEDARPTLPGRGAGTSLAVVPDRVTLVPGELYQFALVDPTVSESPPIVGWWVSGGDIESTGWFRAPGTPGEYQLTGTLPDGRKAEARVTVEPPTEPYFSDDFESCGLSKPAATPGFGWKASLGGASQRPTVTSAIAHSGTCSLKFTFAAGNEGMDAWSEQRFVLGKRLGELYIQWHQYWPDGTETPSVGPKFHHRQDKGPNNNKFLRLWDEDYRHYRVKLGFSTMPKPNGDSEMMTEFGTNERGVGVSGTRGDGRAITAARRGRWVKIQVHVRLATGANNDGVIEMWLDGVRTIGNFSLRLFPGSIAANYLRNGYLMGWANSGFSQQTSTYIDDVIIAGYPIP